MEFGFQRIDYSVSEQPRLRDVSVCVVVNNGTFEREIEITFDVNDVTAESTKPFLIFLKHFTLPLITCTILLLVM